MNDKKMAQAKRKVVKDVFSCTGTYLVQTSLDYVSFFEIGMNIKIFDTNENK